MAEEMTRGLLLLADRGTPRGAIDVLDAAYRNIDAAPGSAGDPWHGDHAEKEVTTPTRRRTRSAYAFAAGMVMVLVVIGGVALLIQQVDLSEDPESTPVSSVVDPAPTTTLDAAPTTTAPSTAAPSAAMAWTRIAEPDVFGGDGWQHMTDVAVGGDIAVAVGYDASGGDDDAAVWFSPDGVTWSRVPHDEGIFGGVGHQRMQGVVATDSGFVAVGLEGDTVEMSTTGAEVDGMETHAAIWQSDDGVRWRRVPHDEAGFATGDFVWMNDVTFGQGRLVAVGQASQQRAPFASERWGPYGDEPNPTTPIDIDADAAVWTSVDGVEWSRVDTGDAVFGGDTVRQHMNAVAAGGPGFVAVGMEGFDYLGVDDWTPVPDNNPDGDAHVMDNVAAVWTSPDGTTWTRVAHGPALVHSGDNVTGWATMFDVTATGSGLVAVGRDLWMTEPRSVHEGAAIWLSNDGVSWHRVAHEITDWPDMAAVIATDNGNLVAAGGMPLYITAGTWTSQDKGNTWIAHPYEDTLFGAKPDTASDAGSPASIQGLAVFGESVVAVGTFDTDAAVWVGTWTGASG